MTGGFAGDLFAGRTAMVTGGGGAIGGAIARGLAEAGCDVIVADIDAERAEAVAAEVRAAGRRGEAVVVDLTTVDSVPRMVEAAGHVDVLINGVGHHLATTGPFEQSTEDQWQALYEVNFLAVLRACRAFVPGMVETGWGRVVNFSSVEGIRAAPHLAVYAGLKRAIDGFTKSLAVDVARRGVLVNAIAVDKTRAYQTDHYMVPEEYEPLVHTWIPTGAYGEPEEVAALAVFLASPLNTWVVGQTVAADGGTLAAGGWYRTPVRWTNQPLLAQYLEDPAVNAARPPGMR